jgi:broad specificity phosphatase PhoE
MRLLLLRHGETNWNSQGRCQGLTDLDLNETGAQQARETAWSLRNESIDAIYSSDLKRAFQTAGAVNKYHDLGVTIDSDLRELNHGDLEGRTFEEVRDAFPEFIKAWRNQPAYLPIPGGESFADVNHRSSRSLERICHRHAQQTVLVVSHQFPIRAILCQITGSPLNHYRNFKVDPCELFLYSYEFYKGWKLLQFYDQSYG